MTHRVHLDYASSAPLRDSARRAMAAALEGESYDPRRLYDDAQSTRYAIEESREIIASCFGCDPFEVIFTSSASESLASFAFGVIPTTENRFAQLSGGPQFSVLGTPYDSEVIHSTWLRENIDIQILAGNSQATLNVESLTNMIDETTRAITIPYAHPDTGTLQDIQHIVNIVRTKNPECFIHIDARLAAGNVALNFADMNIDAMTIEPVTFGGPVGIGALVLSRKAHLSPLLTGGTQERARRSGLENAVAIIGFGAACEELTKSLDTELTNNIAIKRTVCTALEKAGAPSLDFDPDSHHSLNHLTSAYFPGIAASAVVSEFNRAGINIHAGSSCGSEEFEPSQQLAPVTNDDALSESIFRISWGYKTTDTDIDRFVEVLNSLPFSKSEN